ETVELYHTLGMRICTHAIGDIAMDMILEAYEKALAKRPRQDHRHRVEHMGNWMMTPERVARAKRLGILPIANPPFLFFLGDPMVEMLQRRATEQGFPFRTLWDAGFPLSFGSDSPGYYPVDPLRDLGTAVAHQTLSGQKITAGEALTMPEALRSQTINAAYAGFQEKLLGSIAVGKLADLVVLGDDPFTYTPAQFQELPVDITIAGGKVVHTGAVRSRAGAPAPGATFSCSCSHRGGGSEREARTINIGNSYASYVSCTRLVSAWSARTPGARLHHGPVAAWGPHTSDGAERAVRKNPECRRNSGHDTA